MNDTGTLPVVSTLRRLLAKPAGPARLQCCEWCGTPLNSNHRHVADAQSRRLLCACSVCAAAMPKALGAATRLHAVRNRYLHDPSMVLAAIEWDTLGIPVDLAFIFVNSESGRPVACYPGPAGATETLLPLEAWPALVERHQWIRDLAPDVEALLVRGSVNDYYCYVVPIDRCYELVGRIRSAWIGFGGGQRAHAEIEQFFQDVSRRCERGS